MTLTHETRVAWYHATHLTIYALERVNHHLETYLGTSLDELDHTSSQDVAYVLEVAEIPGLTHAYAVPAEKVDLPRYQVWVPNQPGDISIDGSDIDA